MPRATGGDRRGGMRPQCKKKLPPHVKPDDKPGRPALCKMPLKADGTCPEHGKHIS